MTTIKDFSSLSEEIFVHVLRDILDEYFVRQRSSSATTGVDPHVRSQLRDLLRSTNPSALKISDELPKQLQQIYANFVHDYRRDIERYHLQHASEYLDQHRLKDFDWNLRIALHDEHLFKCRLPLMNLQLALTDEQKTKNVLLELDEQELSRLIDEMTRIEQALNNTNTLLSQ